MRINEREKIFLDYLAQGLTSAQIAEQLEISKYTVDDIISRIMLKLNAPNRTRAVTLALEHGLITLT